MKMSQPESAKYPLKRNCNGCCSTDRWLSRVSGGAGHNGKNIGKQPDQMDANVKKPGKSELSLAEGRSSRTR